ncbi:hypothetical protein C8R44DRAFT_880671 [Mycena epipterygia]|nr:hypothetical protein C8R44DRAFT_880671 [Mycena epipterygia]
MKKGHRTNGDLWIKVQHSWGGLERGSYFNENLAIGEFVHEAVRSISTEEGFQFFQEGWHVEVQSSKKALNADDKVAMIKERFNGAESVYVKACSMLVKTRNVS